MSKPATLFNDEYKNKFRTMYLEGKEVKEINEILGFNQNTFENYQYLNTQGLRDWYNNIKREYFLTKAEAFSKKLLSIDECDDARIYALKQKETEFLRSTLGKDIYSSKQEIEQTQPVTINVISKLPELDKQANVLPNDIKLAIDKPKEELPSNEEGKTLDTSSNVLPNPSSPTSTLDKVE